MKATRNPTQEETAKRASRTASGTRTTPAEGFLLWVDGAGGFLVCTGDPVTLGGPGSEADVSLLADLSRRHITLSRSSESYVLEPHGPTFVGDRVIQDRMMLRDGDELRLGTSTKLRFRRPSALTSTAVLEAMEGTFHLSPRQRATNGWAAGDFSAAARTVDGIILFDGVCLLGSGRDKHICCPEAETVVLFRRDSDIYCKSPGECEIDGALSATGGPILPGQTVTAGELRFFVEGL